MHEALVRGQLGGSQVGASVLPSILLFLCERLFVPFSDNLLGSDALLAALFSTLFMSTGKAFETP
jgi:hypothetical protein